MHLAGDGNEQNFSIYFSYKSVRQRSLTQQKVGNFPYCWCG